MSTAHAARVLQEIVEPPRKWGWPTSTKRGYFEGKVAGSRFKIHRVIGYQNSFMPIIEGNFRRDGLGTMVALNMRLVWPVVPVWIGIIVFLAWSSVRVDSPVAGPFGVRMVVIAMTLFIYLVATIPFAIEVANRDEAPARASSRRFPSLVILNAPSLASAPRLSS